MAKDVLDSLAALLEVHAERRQDGSSDALRHAQQTQQNMFRAYVAMVQATGFFLCTSQDAPRLLRE
ncbi:MAG TPA: hypothetical protein VFY10_03580 [Dehalococcoidia bacterium]|nr:hypothetical protein [Dehalococcoidia bacterium]